MPSSTMHAVKFIAGIGRIEGATWTRNHHHLSRHPTKRSSSASVLCKHVPRYSPHRKQTVQVRVQHRRSCYHRRRRHHAFRDVGIYVASAIVRVDGTGPGAIAGGFHDIVPKP